MNWLRLTWSITMLMVLCACQQPATQSVKDDLQVIKSPHDERDYQYLSLDNGLKIMVVSDPNAQMSAASMDVHVGSFSDPVSRPGLAHFLEHMLFLGTENYPKPGTYRSFIQSHGGYANAFTSSEDTVYLFEIQSPQFKQALSQFAEFFISPLFNEAYVDKERHAVDSEYHMGLNNDGMRIHHVMKQLSNPNHPYSRFSVGSIDTLADLDNHSVREDLLEFYASYYSAERMTLSIVGPDSIEDMSQWARELFSAVPVSDKLLPIDIDELVFLPEQLQKDVYIQPVADTRTLVLLFPNTITRDYDNKPASYVQHLLGIESEKSLSAILKKKGWIGDLWVGYDRIAQNQDAITMTISLTKSGAEHIDDITSDVFSYVSFLKDHAMNKSLYDELKMASLRKFMFPEQQPLSYSTEIANALRHHPAEKILQRMSFHPDAILQEDVIEQMFASIIPENLFRIIVMKDVQTNQVEPHYQVPFLVKKLTPEQFNAKAVSLTEPDAFELPNLNPYLPEDLALKASTDDMPSLPAMIVDEKRLKVWHWQDTMFNQPKSEIRLLLKTPVAARTAEDMFASSMFVNLIFENIQQILLQAAVAESTISINALEQGLEISLSGYNDKQDRILLDILDVMVNFVPDEERYNIRMEQIGRSFEGFYLGQPLSRGLDEPNRLLITPSYSMEDMARVFPTMTMTQVEQQATALLQSASIELLIEGNITASEAQDVSRAVYSTLEGSFKNLEDTPELKVAQLTPGKTWIWEMRSEHPDNLMVLYYQMPDKTDTDTLMAQLFAQAYESDFFNQLRTKEQFGYALDVMPKSLQTWPGLVFYLESHSKSSKEILDRVELFIGDMQQLFVTEGSERFLKWKQSLRTKLEEQPRPLVVHTMRNWAEIRRERYQFNRLERLLETLEQLTWDDFSQYLSRTVLDKDTRRRLIITTDATPISENGQILLNEQGLKQQ